MFCHICISCNVWHSCSILITPLKDAESSVDREWKVGRKNLDGGWNATWAAAAASPAVFSAAVKSHMSRVMADMCFHSAVCRRWHVFSFSNPAPYKNQSAGFTKGFATGDYRGVPPASNLWLHTACFFELIHTDICASSQNIFPAWESMCEFKY